MRVIALSLAAALASCATPAPAPVPTPPPPNLAQDAAHCGVVLALAGVMGQPILAAAEADAACMRLPSDLLSVIIAKVTPAAATARRTMRLR